MTDKTKLTREQLSALQYDKHVALTANAGSGKTFVFAKRFVKIALEVNPDLDKMIAITFTEKAAGELYSRIVKEIESLATNGNDLSRLSKIRKKLVSAKISTIHSFCLSLLRDYSPQAGLDANLTPLQPEERDALINKAFDDAYENELTSPRLKALLRYFGGKKPLRKAVKSAIDKRRFVDKLYRNYYKKGVDEATKFLKSNTERLFEKIIEPQIDEAISFVASVNSAIASIKASDKTAAVNYSLALIEEAGSSFEKLKILHSALQNIQTQRGDLLKKGYAGVLENKDELVAQFKEITEFIAGFDFETLYDNLDALAELSVTFLEFYDEVAERFSEAKYQAGYIDFEDILLKAYELLQDDEVLRDLQSKYQYIMVDEYQDTNELQYEIIMPILERLKKGNLFVVGDEKQSIYMFNNAELEVFNETKDEVKNNAGEVLELPHSFRLKPNNALFVNSLFKEIFAEADERFNEVKFNPLIVSSITGEGGRVEILLAEKENENEGNCDEAEIVANKIKRLLLEGEIDVKETAVLTRQNKYVSELEKAFSKEKIPYVVLGGVGYYQELVIRDIQNYLMFLSSVNNDVALLSVLRAPFYSFSDDVLLKISFEKGESYWEKLNAYAELDERAEAAREMLRKHLQYAKSFEIPILLNKILSDTNYWAVLAAKENAEQEIANVKKLIGFSLETLRGEAVSLFEFAVKLNEAIKEVKNEGAAQTSAEESAVKIMTYHKAKGLEFDTVFLYKTGEALQKTTVKSREITFDKDFGLIAKTPSPKGYFYEYRANPLSWIYQYYIRRKESAEAKRLFYVGATRARKNLFISATLNKKGGVAENSFFAMIQKAFGFFADKTSITISGELSFDEKENKKLTEYEISIEKNVCESADFKKSSDNEQNAVKIDVANIGDTEENEFISATKIALYEFCPLNYKLTYELGYGKLYNLLDDRRSVEFEEKENSEEDVPANVLGSVLHKALELEIRDDNFDEKLDEAIASEIKPAEEIAAVKTKAERVLRNFLKSEIHNWLKGKENYRNEYEIYLKNGDFFLFGIIDKLIFDNEKLIVVDYKSDKVSGGKFLEKFKRYEKQLKFYLFILSELYPHYKNFEARLVFLNYPDNSITKNYSAAEIKTFGTEIREIVENIRAKRFPKNTTNCPKCVFFKNGSCVI